MSNYSIVGVRYQSGIEGSTSNHDDELLELARNLGLEKPPGTTILERNSDSLISFSTGTLQNTFDRLKATSLFKEVKLAGPQIAIFITNKKVRSTDQEINLETARDESNADQLNELAKQFFKYESRPLSLEYFYRSRVCQHNENIDRVQELINENKLPEALLTLQESENDSILYSKEILKCEILRKQGEDELADEVVDEIASSIPYDRFSTNLLIRELTNKTNRRSGGDSPTNSFDLLIYDRIFPSLHCSFTTCEFNAYLDKIENAKVLTSGIDFPHDKDFNEIANAFTQHHPEYESHIEKLNSSSRVNAKVYYTLFLGNAYAILPLVEANRATLIFTLYSGGEFCFNDPTSDKQLEEIFNSPSFKKVIVVQKPIYDYLIDRRLVDPSKIEFIYGPICNTDFLVRNRQAQVRYPHGKKTFDIAFVANKNMPRGEDKGYDTFIATALDLLAHSDAFNFHVVGGFDSETISLGDNASSFHFYGHKPMHFFPDFYSRIDIMMSPCRPDTLAPGAIDGAPNVSAIEAGLCGAAVFVTDQLDQNTRYEWDREIVRLTDSSRYNAQKILEYFPDTEALYALAHKGYEAFARTNSYDAQLKPRIELLEQAINDG